MISRRLFFAYALLLLAGCHANSTRAGRLGKLTIGVVTYGEGVRSVDQFQRFLQYLENQTQALIELEPAFNEIKAVQQVQRQAWSLVFAPPGLAAIAISTAQYLPLFPLQGVNNLRSVFVVRDDSSVQNLTDLNGKSFALGQPGSATGFYVPLYELYGITLSEVRVAPTPKTLLEWVANSEVVAGALAKDEFDRHQGEISNANLRVFHTSRNIPGGAVLVSPTIDRNQQLFIQQAMSQALPELAQEAGYIPNAPPPDYKTLIALIEKVKPIESRINEKPAVLSQE